MLNDVCCKLEKVLSSSSEEDADDDLDSNSRQQ